MDSEARCANEVIHLAVEMTPAADPFPAWRQPALPSHDSRFGRSAVLDEKERPARLEDAPHLVQRGARVWDGAQGPGHDDRVEDSIGGRKLLSRRSDQRYRHTRSRCAISGVTEEFGRRVDPADSINGRPIDRQVQPRADPDFKDKATGGYNRPLPIACEPRVPHR